MTIQISIIGLGQIGASIGLALAEHKDQISRVGHDKDRSAVGFAKANDVIDKTTLTLTGAVEKADVVFLTLPLHEIYSVLEHISKDLKDDTLVIDTSPLKAPVLQWVNDFLPETCHYVGFTPVIGSAHLNEMVFGPETSSDDLFDGSLIGITGGKNTTEEAMNLAVNLIHLLGASPYFTDPVEMDGLMTTTYLIPRLLAATLLRSSQNSPGWREARKVASKAYTQLTNSFAQDQIAGALAAALIGNQENTARVVNDLIRELVDIRDMVGESSQEELEELFTKLQQGRDIWLQDRKAGDWIEAPRTEIQKRNMVADLLGFRTRVKPKNKQ
jgi:prephenate dehydrogenase